MKYSHMDYKTANHNFKISAETGEVFSRETGLRVDTPGPGGYRRVRVIEDGENREYQAHRVVWLLHYGRWPVGQLDHKSQVRDENWVDNLRECTESQNQANTPKRRRNTSGFRGVRKSHGKWGASIQANGKPERWLGTFATPQEASVAYQAAYFAEYGVWLDTTD